MVDVVNFLLDICGKLGEGLTWLLPQSPFSGLQLIIDSDILGYINYFVPIAEMVNIGMAWLTAIALWYVYAIVLRWVKAIQ